MAGNATKLDPDAWFAAEMDRLRAEFDAGRDLAFHEAALLCVWNERPLPQWAERRMEAMLRRDMRARSGAKGKPSTLRAEARRQDNARICARVMLLRRRPEYQRNLQGAFRAVAGMQVRDGAGLGLTAKAVENIYYAEKSRRA